MNTYLALTILTLFRPNEQKMIIIIKKSRIGTVQVHSEIWYMKRHTIESSTKRSKREREVTNHCSLSWWRRWIWEGSWSWSRSSSSSSSMPLQRSNSSLLVANFFDIFSLRFSFFVSPNPTQRKHRLKLKLKQKHNTHSVRLSNLIFDYRSRGSWLHEAGGEAYRASFPSSSSFSFSFFHFFFSFLFLPNLLNSSPNFNLWLLYKPSPNFCSWTNSIIDFSICLYVCL